MLDGVVIRSGDNRRVVERIVYRYRTGRPPARLS
jgi:hypothetical protein